MRYWLIPILFLCAGPAYGDDKLDCKDPQDQNSMTRCAGLDYDKADRELNKLWPSLKSSAEDADKDTDKHEYVNALLASQRAWIAYRDAECTWEGFQAHGGSLEPMLVNGCSARVTRERIKELNDNAEGLGN